jgi:hypothetical protein
VGQDEGCCRPAGYRQSNPLISKHNFSGAWHLYLNAIFPSIEDELAGLMWINNPDVVPSLMTSIEAEVYISK